MKSVSRSYIHPTPMNIRKIDSEDLKIDEVTTAARTLTLPRTYLKDWADNLKINEVITISYHLHQKNSTNKS
jgi:hypothetical protein